MPAAYGNTNAAGPHNYPAGRTSSSRGGVAQKPAAPKVAPHAAPRPKAVPVKRARSARTHSAGRHRASAAAKEQKQDVRQQKAAAREEKREEKAEARVAKAQARTSALALKTQQRATAAKARADAKSARATATAARKAASVAAKTRSATARTTSTHKGAPIPRHTAAAHRASKSRRKKP